MEIVNIVEDVYNDERRALRQWKRRHVLRQWEFFENSPLFFKVKKAWLVHIAPKECREWLNERCEDVEVDYSHRYYRFPDAETKTEFLLRWG